MNSLSIRIESEAVADMDSALSKDALFAIFGEKAAESYSLDKKIVRDGLVSRESIGSTGFGGGVAIPHAKIEGLDQCVGMVLRLSEPMAFEAHDAQPVDLIFCLLSPAHGGAEHLKALAEISRFLRDGNKLGKIRDADNDDAVHILLTGQKEQQAA